MNNLLFINWDVSPYIFHIGSFGLRWYSLLFIAGFIFGIWMFRKFYVREGVSLKILDPILYIMLICALLGARLGHVFFYEPSYYLANPGEILKTWHGGLASHGGAIGVLVGVWIYVHYYGKKEGLDCLWVLDRLAVVVPFAGMLIRLGNLMNSEIYGYTTSLPWGFVFPRDTSAGLEPHHPTQLYEALAYLIIGIILLIVYYKATAKTNIATIQTLQAGNTAITTCKPMIYKGALIGLFFTLVFTARFFIEFVKEPQVEAETHKLLNNGQQLSIPFIIVGLAMIAYSYVVRKPLKTK